MSLSPRLTLVTLGVSDLSRSRAFYERLGWRASSASQGDVVFIQLGGVVLSLFPRAALAADAGLDAEGEGFRGVAFAHNVGSPGEVEAALKAAEAAGGRIVKPARRADWGGHAGYFADPDGHLWEIAHNPSFETNDRGEVVLP